MVVTLDIRPIDWCGLPRDYLQTGEMEILAALVREARTVIEIGCRNGRTARVLLHNMPSIERYIGIDVTADYQPALSHQRQEMVDEPGSLAFGDPRFEIVIRPRGSLDLEALELCDAVFIDGDHSRAAVEHDSALARAAVRPGGVIIWHDYHNGAVDVTEVIDRLSADGWPIAHVIGSWIAFCRV